MAVESTTVYRQLGDGAFAAVMLDWRGPYPGSGGLPGAAAELQGQSIRGSPVLAGEAAISGSFWSTAPGLAGGPAQQSGRSAGRR